MKKSQPRVGIVVLNFNGYSDTIDCINSLRKAEYPDYEILVVDNDSHDNSVEILRKEFKDLNILALPTNTGYAGGNNEGIKYFRKKNFPLVLLLNNDTIVEPSYLSSLVETVTSDKSIGLVGPKIYYSGKNTLVSEGGRFDFKNGPFLNINQNQPDKKQFLLPVERDYISGCCFLIKAEVFEKIGGLDDTYFCYVEDVDFSVRCHNAGYKTVYEPRSVIHHKTSRSTGGEINPIKEFYKSRNMVLFGKRYFLSPFSLPYWTSLLKNRVNDSKMALLNKNIFIPFQVVKGLFIGIFYG